MGTNIHVSLHFHDADAFETEVSPRGWVEFHSVGRTFRDESVVFVHSPESARKLAAAFNELADLLEAQAAA
jgi:hypothetical protein